MTDDSPHNELDMRLSQLRELREGVLYYAFIMLGTDDGHIEWGAMSQWAGPFDDDDRFELRKPRYVYGAFAKLVWEEHFGQPYVIINDADDLPLYFAGGGNALIAENVANECLAEFLEPHPVAHDARGGYISLTEVSPEALRRAPTPKLRMSILNRDNRRCRICGRRPDDYVDVELHVHHIRPWVRGGLTETENLITLCHTCHNGLDPHEDHSLYEYTIPESLSKGDQTEIEKFFRGVINYRRIIHESVVPAADGE